MAKTAGLGGFSHALDNVVGDTPVRLGFLYASANNVDEGARGDSSSGTSGLSGDERMAVTDMCAPPLVRCYCIISSGGIGPHRFAASGVFGQVFG
ncbi:MAG TPA: hypothetical protein VHI72_08455, partial [Hyphomicrobiaceae bacterium]|nr:hypothetical protein [Hyphomicrobiaceae bacterium]